jgi:hypothetical protein
MIACTVCDDARFVCEDDPKRLWGIADGCDCRGAGAPCPVCNPCDSEHPPQMPEGYRRLFTGLIAPQFCGALNPNPDKLVRQTVSVCW